MVEERVEQIDGLDRLAQLRGLLGQEPSPSLWQAIKLLFRDWPTGAELETALGYATSHLEDWPPALRVIDWAERSAAYASLGEVLRVLYQPDELLLRLFEEPSLARWSGLEMSLSPLSLKALLASPQVSLETLLIRESELDEQALYDLCHSPLATGIRQFGITGCQLDPSGLAVLAGSPLLEGLEELQLFDNFLDDRALSELTSTPAIRALQSLDLGLNMFTERGLFALASCSHLKQLQRLYLDTSMRDDYSARGFLSVLCSPHLPALEVLSCHYLPPEDDEEEEREPNLRFTKSWWEDTRKQAPRDVPPLRSFRLDGIPIDNKVLDALLSAPKFRGIESLAIHGSPLGNDGLARLAAEAHLADLKVLSIEEATVGDSGLLALALSNQLGSLQQLSLRNNHIGFRLGDMSQQALHALARSSHYPLLSSIDLRGNHCSIESIKAFLLSDQRDALQLLQVSLEQTQREEWQQEQSLIAGREWLLDIEWIDALDP